MFSTFSTFYVVFYVLLGVIPLLEKAGTLSVIENRGRESGEFGLCFSGLVFSAVFTSRRNACCPANSKKHIELTNLGTSIETPLQEILVESRALPGGTRKNQAALTKQQKKFRTSIETLLQGILDSERGAVATAGKTGDFCIGAARAVLRGPKAAPAFRRLLCAAGRTER